MSYNYGAPPQPPPPPSQPAPQSYGPHPGYGQPAHRGGGAQGRGRGGGSYTSGYGTGRGDYQAAAQQSPYTYPYSSPSTPAQYGSEGGYQGQWQHEHGQAPPPHGHHGAHAPAPISSSNYHPNYTQPGYAQQPQYSHHPGYGPPAQPQYSSPYGGAPPPSPQWAAPTNPPQQAYGGGRPHHRGGYQGDRAASRGGPLGQGVRAGYRDEAGQAQVNGGYGGQYPESRPPPPQAAQYAPPAQTYQYAPPPPPPPQAVGAPRQDQYYSHNRRGGRGGFRDGHRGGRPHFQGRSDKVGPKKANHGNHADNSHKADQLAAGKKKKRKVNTLGLTPANASGSEDEEEDDESEEQRLSDLMGNETFQITNLAAYLAERKGKFPTEAHVKAKKAAELAAQTEKEEETSRLERERERLKRRLEKVESSIKRKREQQDEGDEMRHSSADGDESSEDEKPEVLSSRPSAAANASEAPAPVPPPPPAKKADITKHCKYYSTGGSCGKKGKCRFVHDPTVREAAIREKEANNGQLTIKQRLILNDKEQEDLSILESIQYIREKGLVKAGSGLGKVSATRPTETAPNRPAKVGSLPAPPPSLPPPPIKREGGAPKNSPPERQGLYQGWNLGGYGGTGIKPEDLP